MAQVLIAEQETRIPRHLWESLFHYFFFFFVCFEFIYFYFSTLKNKLRGIASVWKKRPFA